MPTLYSAEGHRKPKLSITELVLYNMASMLASVATGYDVRMSNVSPLHPKLQPQMYRDDDDDDTNDLDLGPINGQLERGGFAHNTYHGPPKHLRYVHTILCNKNLSKLIKKMFKGQHYHHYLQCLRMIDPYVSRIHLNTIICHQQCPQQVV